MDWLRFFGNSRLPMIHQSENSECGLACLAMVSGYHGHNTSLQEMRCKYGISLKGLTLRGLIDIAAAINLSTRALRIELNELGKVQLPAILHWDFNHFVTLKKVTRKYIEVHNPSLGVRRYPLQEAGTHFTGIALELSPAADFSRADEPPRLRLSDFWRDLSGLNRLLIQILILSMIIQVVSLVSPFYMQLVVDEVLIKQDLNLLNVLGLGFFGLTLISVFTKLLRSYGQLFLVNQINFALGSSLFHHLIRLPLDYFHKRHMGDVISRFGSIKNIQEFITASALIVLLDGIMAVTTLIMILIYSPLLSFIILTCLALYALLRVAMFTPLKNRTHESIAKAANQESNFMESVRAIKSIKAFGRESDREGVWNNKLADTINSEIRIGKLTLGFEFIDAFLTGTCQVLVVFVGATQVIEGILSIGMLYAFMSYQRHFNSAMISLIDQLTKIMMIKLHLERLADIALTPKEPGLDNLSAFSVPMQGVIALKDASFRYSPMDPLIVEHLNININPGEAVAIYGPSGSGKSTIINMLSGLMQPTDGCLYIDHQPLKVFGMRAYRANTGAVLQSDSLLSGNVRENISFSNTAHDDQAIERAARLAEIHHEIMAMPMGYDSLIGDMGTALSLGQQQRILIARALYHKPRVIFMDEGTAHIDAKTEIRIMQKIRELGISCVFISHNKSLLKYADKIVHLVKGEVRVLRASASKRSVSLS